jgi:molybdate transport system substrate-binding protein
MGFRHALLVPILAVACAAAGAAEVTVLSTGAPKAAMTGAIAAWEAKTGNKVNVLTWLPAGDLRKKIAGGERADIVVIPAEHIAPLGEEGVIESASRRDLASVSIGAAVKQGAPVPDISTPEKLKQALLAAKSVTYMDPTRGTSGKYFDEVVLPKLGVREEVRAKTQLGEGGYIAEKVARGEVELVVHQATEILPVKGVTFIGLIPAELQKATLYTGVVMKGAKNPREAQSLLDFLAAPEGRKFFLDRGYAAP